MNLNFEQKSRKIFALRKYVLSEMFESALAVDVAWFAAAFCESKGPPRSVGYLPLAGMETEEESIQVRQWTVLLRRSVIFTLTVTYKNLQKIDWDAQLRVHPIADLCVHFFLLKTIASAPFMNEYDIKAVLFRLRANGALTIINFFLSSANK